MIEEYVNLDSPVLEIVTRGYLTVSKHPGLVVKRRDVPLTDNDLSRLGAARFDEPEAEGYRVTGNALPVGGGYVREYAGQTVAEARLQRESDLAATDAGMTRTEEDIIDTLDRLGVMPKSELPASTLARLTDKKAKRSAL